MIVFNGNAIFRVGDKVAQDMYTLSWHPGQENLANYQSKHHLGSHHQTVHPWYLHQVDSPRNFLGPSSLALKRCVGTLKNGYLHKVPSPQVPCDQSTIPVACTATYTVNPQPTGYLPDPRIPLCNNLKRLLLDVSKCALAPLSLCKLM
jgi:hypothetical protein